MTRESVEVEFELKAALLEGVEALMPASLVLLCLLLCIQRILAGIILGSHICMHSNEPF